MKIFAQYYLSLLLLLFASTASAAEIDHSQHGAQGAMKSTELEHAQHASHARHGAMQQQAAQLQVLDIMPASGKAREGGYDGRSVMESTGHVMPLAARCAQASRGLVMLDSASWEACGGKPQGAPASLVVNAPAKTGDHAGHHQH